MSTTARGGLGEPPYASAMAYDEELADRIRELLSDRADVSEQKMFGGLGFMVGGNMAIAASGAGGVLVRADPDQSDHLVATTAAEMAVMQGRPMAGWLRVAAGEVATRRQLERWVKVGTTFAASLPAKGSSRGPAKSAPKTAGRVPAKGSSRAAAKAPAQPAKKGPARKTGRPNRSGSVRPPD